MTNPAPRQNIVDIAVGNPDFSLLVRALATANLVDTVRDLDFITVFAPTNAAFAQLATDLGYTGSATDEDGVFNFLVGALGGLGDPVEVLTDVLLYHVSPGAKTAHFISVLPKIDTALEGASFTALRGTLSDNDPEFTNANIVAPDIRASNGIVQVIDRVLLPVDLPNAEPQPNIVDIALGNPDFEVLVKALSAANLVDTIASATDITVFAPTDEAFLKLATTLGFAGDGTDADAIFNFLVEALGGLGDPVEVLTNVLLYHVSPEAQTLGQIAAAETVPTLLTGASLNVDGIEIGDADPELPNPKVVLADVAASNGVIQAIDSVLLPIDLPTANVVAGNNRSETLKGSNSDDVIFAEKGNDKVFAFNGDDIVDAGRGKDFVSGGQGDDLVRAGGGQDTVLGGWGDDTLRGENGKDYLLGGNGNDELFGDKGADTLIGGRGNDELTGGSGADVFTFSGWYGHDTVTDFQAGVDEIAIRSWFTHGVDNLDISQDGQDVVIKTYYGGSIRLEDTELNELSRGDFVFY